MPGEEISIVKISSVLVQTTTEQTITSEQMIPGDATLFPLRMVLFWGILTSSSVLGFSQPQKWRLSI
jgi:hypothetical protein